MDSLILDLRYAVRTLLKSPGFTLVTVLTFALGIGATTAVFSVVEAVLLRTLPFPDADRLVDIKQVQEAYRGPLITGSTSPLTAYRRWSAAAGVFDATAAYSGQSAVLRGRGPAERVATWAVSSGFLPLLGGVPERGRAFRSEEDGPAAPPVAVLSHAFWATRMGSDAGVIGRPLTLDTTVYTVVGVLPARFDYPAGAQVWTNMGALLAGPQGAERARRWQYWALARLAPGVSPRAAQDRLDVVSRRAWATDPDARSFLPVVRRLHDALIGNTRVPLLVALGAVGLVLLIACTNVASLVLSRSLARAHHVAMRSALGASRARLVRAALAETLVLAGAGAALGMLLAVWLVPALVHQARSELPRVATIALDGRAVAAGLALSAFAGLLTGALPAWQAARMPPAEVLKSGGNDRASAGAGPLGGALVVGQLALTTMLLVGAALLLRTFIHLTRQPPGFEPRHLLVADVALPTAGYARPEARLEYVRRAIEAVAALPGVTGVAVGTGIPLSPGGINVTTRQAPDGHDSATLTFMAAVSPDYFRVLGIPLLRGRVLQADDPDAVVVDAATARTAFPGADPIGRAFLDYGKVAGVVGNVRQEMLPTEGTNIYSAYGANPSGYFKVLTATSGDPRSSAAAVRRRLQDVDPDVPVGDVTPMTTLMADALARQRFYAQLLGAFGVLALAISVVGVYGLVSYAVGRRTREFGIRIALGADRQRVLRLVLARGAALTAVGVGLGLAGALTLTRTLRSLVVGVAPTDPAALAGAAALLVVAALAATYLPARRATRVDPMVALRSE